MHRQRTVFVVSICALALAGLAAASGSGATRTAPKAPVEPSQLITGGARFTCAVLDTGGVRCWGLGAYGALGYGNKKDIGDNETPASAGPVKIHAPKGAAAVIAGGRHSCAVLMLGGVRCWGLNSDGQLGYANTKKIGDNETPGSVGPVKLGGKVPTS